MMHDVSNEDMMHVSNEDVLRFIITAYICTGQMMCATAAESQT